MQNPKRKRRSLSLFGFDSGSAVQALAERPDLADSEVDGAHHVVRDSEQRAGREDAGDEPGLVLADSDGKFPHDGFPFVEFTDSERGHPQVSGGIPPYPR